MAAVPAVRQLVFLAADLESTLAAARRELGLENGVKDEAGMAELGFVHEVLTIENTFLEFTAPLGPETMPAKLLSRRGDLGYMVVIQVADIEATRQRAAELGLSPVMETLYEGHTITQWHPRDFGTLAEFDQIRPADTWHMAPAIFERGSTEVVQDISAIDIAVAEPASMAVRWAEVLEASVGADGTSLELSGVSVRFVTAADAVGLVAVELPASDRAQAGRTLRLSGVEFRLV